MLIGEQFKKETRPVIEVKDIRKRFTVGKNLVLALRGVSFVVRESDFVLIYGPSGCGKSTLLNILSGLDTPSDGTLLIDRFDIFKLNDDQRARKRAKMMGIVHQIPYWIKSLNVAENVALPLIISKVKEGEAIRKAHKLLKEIGIDDLSDQLPTQLSGGQQQRVGIARALVADPEIILADEPTGNLDTSSADEIMSLFDLLNRKHKRTIILVTHNQAYWDLGTKRVEMKDGKVENIRENT